MRRNHTWMMIICCSLGALTAMVLLGVGGPIRVVLAFWSLLLCPGMAFAPLLRLNDPWDELLLGFVFSAVIGIILTLAMLAAAAWSTSLGLTLTITASLIGIGLQRLLRTGEDVADDRPAGRAAGGGSR